MHFIPKSKYDLVACSNLEAASDKEITPYLTLVFEWTKDYNWPVAPRIYKRLSLLGHELQEPLKRILASNDKDWIWFIIFFLFPDLKKEVIHFLKDELISIIDHKNKYEPELIIEINNILNRSSRT